MKHLYFLIILFTPFLTYSRTFSSFSGNIKNLTSFQNSQLEVTIRWACGEGVIHSHRCSDIIEKSTQINQNGTFKMPSFETPGLSFGQWEEFAIFIKSPVETLLVTSFKQKDWKKKLTQISFLETESVVVQASLKNGKDVNEWIQNYAPRGYLEIISEWGVNIRTNGYKILKIESFPFTIPNYFFVTTSPEDTIFVKYPLTTPRYNTHGYGVTNLANISYSGAYDRAALQKYSHIILDSSLVNTDISG
ncbi:MAG: hypothetical protein KDD45_07890, partial [Bdellovibrionales bacterium]|nr:hypothetical protein [Bdellovibrionales bacterium]